MLPWMVRAVHSIILGCCERPLLGLVLRTPASTAKKDDPRGGEVAASRRSTARLDEGASDKSEDDGIGGERGMEIPHARASPALSGRVSGVRTSQARPSRSSRRMNAKPQSA